ncbi:unnamed protein product [Protopolystoma xenopodis]|uniref:Uncharacterized protein n=1 Tax=Protopolystoma xenopodis TaxID=117903 RepID=A0A448XGC1_9PLAT|nr:unnamed protein product [Protopolystoma xenopodis]
MFIEMLPIALQNQEQARTEDQATVQATSLESHSNEDESSNAVLSPPAEQTSSSSNKDSAQKRPLEPATEEVLDPKRICTPTRVVTLKLEDVISTVHTSSDTDVESTHWKVKSEPIEKAALDSSCLNHSDCNAIDPIPPHPESPEQTLSSTTGILEPLVIQPDLATISYETIKADPLAALKAVLSRGAMAASTSSKG